MGRETGLQEEIQNAGKPQASGTIAESTKWLASRYYQLKTGHACTGQYLDWAKFGLTTQCWWCQYPSQTRDHPFKVCPEWKMQ